MPTVRDVSDAVETKLARDLGLIYRKLADTWAELTDAADGAPGPADVERLTDLARRLLTAYAAANGPLVVQAQAAAVAAVVASSRPEGVATWKPPDPAEASRLAGVVRGGEPVIAWLLGKAGDAGEAIRALLEEDATVDSVAGFASALGGLGALVLVGSRTAVHDAGRSATLATYRANPDQVTGWRWEATLDDATCLACVSLHGTVFSLDDEFQESHIGCRCESTPERTGHSDSNDTGDDWLASRIADGDLRNIPASARDDLVNGRLELRDFVTRGTDTKYGRDYREASVRTARERAAREGR